jgi:hypothetical protein
MFGMLDYRAHKYWLLTFPIRVIARLIFLAYVAIAIPLGIATGLQPIILQMIIAYVIFEAIGIVCGILWWLLITWPIDKIFFWTIDVIPSKGEYVEEANEIVRKGRIIWLAKKMNNHIDEWTYEDSHAFVSLYIRARGVRRFISVRTPPTLLAGRCRTDAC